MKLLAQKRGSLTTARRGVLTTWMIWIMLASGVIVGAVFNIMWMSAVRNDARNCSAAAALAAGHSYLSDDILRSWQQTFEYDGRVARSQNVAVSVVEDYRKYCALPPISPDHVKVEWPETEVSVQNPSQLVPTKISVGFNRGHKASQGSMFFGGLTGKQSEDIGVTSSVVLEHAPAAFKPAPNNTVPMLPFAIMDQPSVDPVSLKPVSSGYWTSSIESGTGRDGYSWNNETRDFEIGPDGLPEVTVMIYSGASANAEDAFIPFGEIVNSSSSSSSRIPGWIEKGLNEADLRALGLDQVSFPSLVPTAVLSSPLQGATVNALQRKIGEACIVCLCTTDSVESASLQKVRLTRPVAARIVEVTANEKGNVKVTLQPCVLVTSTAITSKDTTTSSNRYIYSVRLCD